MKTSKYTRASRTCGPAVCRGRGDSHPVSSAFEPLESRTLFCDWGWHEAASVVGAPVSAAAAAPADAATFAHGGALHVDANLVGPATPQRLTAAVALDTPAPGTTTLRIETGGSSGYTDTSGRYWSADS